MKMIVDILKEINDDVSTIEKYKSYAALQIIAKHAFDPEHKFILPEGVPPYKEDPAPLGMSPGNFTMELRRLYVFCRVDLTPVKRESIFINMLESIHPSEAKVLLAIKDQQLDKLYPSVTKQLLIKVGLLDPKLESVLVQQEPTPQKRKAGRPKKVVEPVQEPVLQKRKLGRPKKNG